MKLLVTGGAGFIGSHFICQWLESHAGDSVVNVDSLTYAAAQSRLEGLGKDSRYQLIRGDICDAKTATKAVEGCDALVHFAAETHVDRSITDAAPFLRTNVEGVYVLLNAALAAKVKRIVHISTDEVYGPVLEGAVDESARLAPRSPYAASKAAGDLLAQSFRDTFNLPVVVARPTNIYGPGQFPEKFIPLAISRALDNQPVPIYGDGQQRRGWLHVHDAAQAIALLLEKGKAGEVYNVGSGSEQANWEVAKRILTCLGKPESLLKKVEDRPGHDRRYSMNDAKIRALGWSTKVSFEKGLPETVAWYQEHAAWWRPLAERLSEDPYHWLDRASRPGTQPSARKVG